MFQVEEGIWNPGSVSGSSGAEGSLGDTSRSSLETGPSLTGTQDDQVTLSTLHNDLVNLSARIETMTGEMRLSSRRTDARIETMTEEMRLSSHRMTEEMRLSSQRTNEEMLLSSQRTDARMMELTEAILAGNRKSSCSIM